ncbi:MAG: ABC transporter ATP-binding protein [Clostridia bacterium]
MENINKLLDIKDLSIHYFTETGVVRAVNNIDFELNRGETLGLVGETGAGKTTTALGIMGLIPDPPGKVVNGEILFEGQNLLKASKAQLRHHCGKDLSMIFQDPMTSLNPILTVGDQISEVIRLHEKLSRKDATRKAAEILEMVGIPAERMSEYPHQFSGGMKQRVVIAIALACNPKLIIADEPTTALDVTIQAQVLELMHNLQQKLSTAMLLITHDLGVVADNCDRVAIMYAGQIVEMGSLKDVYDETKHPYTKGLFASLPSLSTKTKRLVPIKGLMPDPTDLPSGCPFHPRCPSCMEACKLRMPENNEVAPGHYVRCLLYEACSTVGGQDV